MEYVKKNKKWEEDWKKYSLSHKFHILMQTPKRLFTLQFVCEQKNENMNNSLSLVVCRWLSPEYSKWWQENKERLLKEYQRIKGKKSDRCNGQKCATDKDV
eukprot:TRINITY_DN4514_c1_g4_i3.p3 TRINITY_DN4514_c1_g4~~TRINITY_DN4514_c1_g4_i3.p3  ORF type:complete len:101 (+),score=14.16 TRINITY_DN4514_c1_g4_i3:676-978(+)